MTIPYAVKQKAEKGGIVLTEVDEPKDAVKAFYPKYNLETYGIGGKAAFEQMAALVRIKSHDDTRVIVNDPTDPFMVMVFNHDRSLTPFRGSCIPTDAYNEIAALDQKRKPWLSTKVPDDGGEAFKQGFMAADNPFNPNDEEAADDEGNNAATLWDMQFDAAADADQEAEDDAGGSVVKQVYRIRYAEAGHPNHCGDWLADTLNNLVLGKTATDIANFEAICNLNGVSLAKYKRDKNGWQGRLRMTGRNLLARIVFETGVLKVPASVAGEKKDVELRAPREWLDDQNFKTKKAKAILEEGRAKQAETVVPDAAEQVKRIKAARGKK